ncbi:hypothetical protein SAMN04488128_1011385 [Chitinophaga eiseniae]|uniref:DUF1772 domain-containing protein n=1 Tax=Chitinophaga eiseniae TaxID=634771 RepID=A0A1T4N2R0_9BACT|nr:hypothetical protein [Chitinophaga eiseniae]SJZ73295.1 hypothetical protein SAMN04488128_1011385 [Chitinophaga eiseniae]
MHLLSLWTATLTAAIVFLAGSWERIFRMPHWFADPPHSFSLIAPQTKQSARFWIPLQLLFLLSFITALVTNWSQPQVRPYLLLALVSFLLVTIPTATYFVKEIIAFSKMTPDTPCTPELLRRSSRWIRWTTSRNVLQFISLILLIWALFNRYH